MGIFTKKATFTKFFFEKTEKKFRVGPILLGSVGKSQPDTFLLILYYIIYFINNNDNNNNYNNDNNILNWSF